MKVKAEPKYFLGRASPVEGHLAAAPVLHYPRYIVDASRNGRAIGLAISRAVVCSSPPGAPVQSNPKRAPAAETDRLGDRLGLAIPEHLERRRIPRVAVEGEDRPGGEGEVLAVLARKLLGERAVVEVRLGQ